MSDYGLPSVAYHEAGHCVMHIRTGGQVDWVTITRKGDADGGVSANGLWTNIATVAGHFAELRWAYTTPRMQKCRLWHRRGGMLDGSQGDFLAIVRDARDYRQHCIEQNVTGARIKKVDRETARKVWNREMRRLNALTKRDPSFERQVHSVAAALMEKGRLTGDEVKQIMASSGVEQSEAFDGGHVEVVILNKGQGE